MRFKAQQKELAQLSKVLDKVRLIEDAVVIQDVYRPVFPLKKMDELVEAETIIKKDNQSTAKLVTL